MAENSKIEWCDHTFNPWTGCTKVSPGCDHCYAESWAKRSGTVVWGPGSPRRRTTPANWRKPLQWNGDAVLFQAAFGRRQRVFCASLADVFDNDVPPEWRADLWALIRATPHLDWLLLTKRIGNAASMMYDAEEPLPNVWLGATVVNQEEASRDILKLIATPARVRFLSIEPMLGPITLRWLSAFPESAPYTAQKPGGTTNEYDGLRRLNWVICGGESGPGARPMHPDWARTLRNECTAAGVPFLFKQWGEWVPRSACYHTFSDGKSCSDMDPSCKRWPNVTRLTNSGGDGHRLEYVDGGDDAYMQKVGKAFAGRLLDGIEHNGFPA